MSEKKNQPSIAKNFIMNALLTMSSFIFPLITFPYISRILLPVGTGKISFATSLINYFNMIAQLGIPTYGIRACARVRDDREELTRTVHELFFINIVMTVVSYVVLFICLILVPRLQTDKNLYIIISFTIILTSIGMEWLYKGLEQYTFITIRSIIFKFIALVMMFLLIHKESDYVIYGGITVIASSASFILNFIYAHKYIEMHPIGGYHPKRHLKAIFVFFAMTVATTIYTNLDTVMLGFMKTDADVGYYNAAVKVKTILVSVVTSLGTVLLPRASYYIENGEKEKFKRISEKALNFVFVLAIPLMIYFMLFADQCITFLSGSAFEGAIVPMQIIMPTLLFIGISNITGIQILVPIGQEKAVLISEILGAVVDLIINFMLIPKFKSSGAAIGTLVAEFVVLAYQYYALQKIMDIKIAFKKIHYRQIILASVVAVLASVWILELQLPVFVLLVISAICFYLAYYLILFILKEPFIREITNMALEKVNIKK